MIAECVPKSFADYVLYNLKIEAETKCYRIDGKTRDKILDRLHNFEVTNMDIMLERILSLIPKKENGDFQHGALKAFANSIGLKSGNLVSDWLKGRSESYKNYIYEVSAKYGVTVEWLKGETDEKNPPVPEDERKLNEELISRLVSLTPEEMQKVDAFVQGLLANR